MRVHRRCDSLGFTLIELLVVIAILAALAALLFPVLSGATETGRQNTCRNQLRNLAIGLTNYAQRTGAYPGYMNALEREDGAVYHNPFTKRVEPVSWVVMILPDLDRAALFDQWRRVPADETGAAGSNYVPSTHVRLGWLECPSDPPPSTESTPTAYVVNAGIPDFEAALEQPASSGPPPRRECGCALCAGGPSGSLPRLSAPRDAAANGVFFDHFTSSRFLDPRSTSVKVLSSPERIADPKDRTILLTENVDALGYALDPPPGSSGSAAAEFYQRAEAQIAAVWDPKSTIDPTTDPPGMTPPAATQRINAGAGTGTGASYAFSRPSSRHPQGVNVAFAGQNVVFLRESVSYFVYAKLMAADDARAFAPNTADGPAPMPEAFRTYQLRDSEVSP